MVKLSMFLFGLLGLFILMPLSVKLGHPLDSWILKARHLLLLAGGWGSYSFALFLLLTGIFLLFRLGFWIIPLLAFLSLGSLLLDLELYFWGNPQDAGMIGVWLGSKMLEYLGRTAALALVACISIGLLVFLGGDLLLATVFKGVLRFWRLLWGLNRDVDGELEEDRYKRAEEPEKTHRSPRSIQTKKSLPTLDEIVSSISSQYEDTIASPEKNDEVTSGSSEGDVKSVEIREAPSFSPDNKRGRSVRAGKYRLPGLDLLGAVPSAAPKIVDKGILEEKASLLEEKLSNYGVVGKVVSIHYGPVITMFEFQPAAGVKVSKIANLADDVAMAMKALGVRIVAPIPGKDVVGIEIPNERQETVFFQEILASQKFQKSRSPLSIGLGKDIFGRPFITQLQKMPHLLVAGATGSGKSVGLNAIICSILYKATPLEVKFILVDPKMLEFSVYNGVPHLATPVITDPRKAASALNWAVAEMENRYTVLTEKRVRNVETYNRYADDPFPYLVIVIDELADLMMVAGREVEMLIARLAQKARAAGIHLVVATQRPSVDVITGLIKANFPSRISFKVSSKVDSRTILDSMGAEKLLGTGDMLFLPPGTSELVRLHGAYISDEEISRIAHFWKEQEEPQFIEGVISKPVLEEEFEDDLDDELYPQAVDLVVRTGHASASMIQRYLKVGYNRGARLLERMEREGIVGPAQGSKPREVLIKPEESE